MKGTCMTMHKQVMKMHTRDLGCNTKLPPFACTLSTLNTASSTSEANTNGNTDISLGLPRGEIFYARPIRLDVQNVTRLTRDREFWRCLAWRCASGSN
jgi:hypothetical protein